MSHGKMEMMKAERDPAKAEMMKQEMMKEMMKEMKHEMMKKMKEMMKEYGSMNAMKKPMNAMMKKEDSNKYLDTKAGSIQDIARQMFEKEHQLVEVKGNDIEKMISDYLKKGGTITKLPPALAKGMKQSDMQKHKVGDKGVIKSMKMKEVRDFVDTYNKHFLTNWAAEELLAQK
jgi:transcription termination factor NusB